MGENIKVKKRWSHRQKLGFFLVLLLFALAGGGGELHYRHTHRLKPAPVVKPDPSGTIFKFKPGDKLNTSLQR